MTAVERIRNFRAERLGRIIAEETPVPLKEGARIVLHIVPFGAFDPTTKVDFSVLQQNASLRLRKPILGRGENERYNFDGLVIYDRLAQLPSPHTYLQVFRNGIIEAVEAYLLNISEQKQILSVKGYDFEEMLIEALDRFLSLQSLVGVEPPLFVMLTLLRVSGYVMYVRDRFHFQSLEYTHPIDRDVLLIPELTVESFELEAADFMRPAFDAVWNASGWPRSMNYDEKGKWEDLSISV
ncbi:MAG: hypothetical protein M5R40_01545 [Anaerolineae bacterium]|nr:hypothetical protein [Anaerolineae bacterium]